MSACEWLRRDRPHSALVAAEGIVMSRASSTIWLVLFAGPKFGTAMRPWKIVGDFTLDGVVEDVSIEPSQVRYEEGPQGILTYLPLTLYVKTLVAK